MKAILPVIKRIQQTWQNHGQAAIITAALLSAGIMPALAAGTPAGTTINNTAYGSFENPAAPGTPIPIDSNTVTLTIAEVAGIDVAAGTATEAPSGVSSAGPGQGDGVISAEDVVYFTFRITNIGNDQTQFFIPDVPASITNGSFNAATIGPIRIVGYNDGTNPTQPFNLAIPSGGAATGSGSLGTTLPNGGSVPVNGYLEIRVPIKANAGLVPGTDQLTVVMGNTVDAASQNVGYVAGGEFGAGKDIFTQDNPGTANGDLAGGPNPEREASDRLTVGLGAPNLDYGDAPDAAPGTAPGDYETVAGRGPSHVVNGTTYLGTGVDAETNAFNDGNPEDNGVVLNNGGTNPVLHGQSLVPGQAYQLDVTTAGSGVLNAWIDFNRDGDFADAGEQIATDVAPTANLITLTGTIPLAATPGTTYARFRYSTVNGLGPTAPAPNGEVEDYQITLVPTAPAFKLVKRITRVGSATFTAFVDDAGDTDDNAANWPAGYLQGNINAPAEPGQQVDYTLYFLSDGNSPVSNVRLCDLIPTNTTYVPGSLRLSQGGGAPAALTDTSTDSDNGYSFNNTAALVAPCQGTNGNGGVYVTVPSLLPNATSPGTPAGSYGYVRFTVTVD